MNQTIHYQDLDNHITTATLKWEGPGWYADIVVGGHCLIVKVGVTDHGMPDVPTGFGASWKANTIEKAAGEYSGHELTLA